MPVECATTLATSTRATTPQGDDHDSQQMPGVPHGGATRRRARARPGRRRAGGRAGIFGGDAGGSEFGDWGGWEAVVMSGQHAVN